MTNLEETVRFDAAELMVDQSLYLPIIKCILCLYLTMVQLLGVLLT